MTDEQIENFRRVLCSLIGPYAVIMPKEEIVRFRDKFQNTIDTRPVEDLEKITLADIISDNSKTRDTSIDRLINHCKNYTIEEIKVSIDENIQRVEENKLICPDKQRKSYYLKCCYLVFAFQRLSAGKGGSLYNQAAVVFKNWLTVLRENKL